VFLEIGLDFHKIGLGFEKLFKFLKLICANYVKKQHKSIKAILKIIVRKIIVRKNRQQSFHCSEMISYHFTVGIVQSNKL